MENLAGYFAPVLIYVVIFVLNAVLPGRWVTGYATREGSTEKLRYRLNGLLVLVVVAGAWAVLCQYAGLPWDWLYIHRWEGLIGAVVAGLVFSLAVVAGRKAVKSSFLADFYLGRAENLQMWGGRIDAKMWLYLVGAIMLELNVLSFAAYHHFQFGAEASMGIYLAAGCLTWFVLDYLTFEEVHLYTYDLFAERVGFKLGWGCLAFYPYFYAVPLWATVSAAPRQMPAFQLVLFLLVFLLGWSLARGANMQKYTFKRYPERSFLGIRPGVITDGNRSLLASGYWGLSRHINYLGEILMATGIVLCTGHYDMIWPWLYPLYYVALLFPRQVDDDKRCAEKYGPLWDQYVEKVPYRIIPYLY
jgi:delta14-sterol reductase